MYLCILYWGWMGSSRSGNVALDRCEVEFESSRSKLWELVSCRTLLNAHCTLQKCTLHAAKMHTAHCNVQIACFTSKSALHCTDYGTHHGFDFIQYNICKGLFELHFCHVESRLGKASGVSQCTRPHPLQSTGTGSNSM